jgi:hypothetical protein
MAEWIVLIGVEFIHGALRTIFLVPYVGEFHARQIGVFAGSFSSLICWSRGFMPSM